MYTLSIRPKLKRKLKKLAKKDIKLLEATNDKIEEILLNPHHYKPLRWPMQGLRRAHIGSFVLVFRINEEDEAVEFFELEHHDDAYMN